MITRRRLLQTPGVSAMLAGFGLMRSLTVSAMPRNPSLSCLAAV
jgi:hypothetical protein